MRADEQNSSVPKRTTVILPEVLNSNIEAFCLKEGVNKNEAMLRLITHALGLNGFKPGRIPQVFVRY